MGAKSWHRWGLRGDGSWCTVNSSFFSPVGNNGGKLFANDFRKNARVGKALIGVTAETPCTWGTPCVKEHSYPFQILPSHHKSRGKGNKSRRESSGTLAFTRAPQSCFHPFTCSFLPELLPRPGERQPHRSALLTPPPQRRSSSSQNLKHNL
jgi:hypothetical protein